MRPLGVSMIVIGFDSERGPELYQVDPSGYYAGHRACSAGSKDQEVINYLEKRISAKPVEGGA